MAKHSEEPLPVTIQVIAVQAMLNESRLSLEQIAQTYPSLAKGVAELTEKAKAPKKPWAILTGTTTIRRRPAKREIL